MSLLPTLLLLLILALSEGSPTLPQQVRIGLNFDSCNSSDDCLAPRRCRLRVCVSAETLPCEDSSACTDGEVCLPNPLSEDNGLVCISEAASQTNDDEVITVPPAISVSPEAAETAEPSESLEPSSGEDKDEDEDEVCVDAEALAHLPARDLVFATHRVARVLCDTNGSCATRGHIVVWRGVPMMMRSYCREVVCEARTIKVNAPRYRRKLRVESQTSGLHFTALAARYETVVEERALHLAVRFGW